MGGLQLNPRLTAGEIPPREGARVESEGRAGREGRATGKREGASGAGQAGTVPQHKHRRDGCVARYSSLAGRLEASGFPSGGLQGLIGFSVQGLHTLGFQLRASRLRGFNLGCMSLRVYSCTPYIGFSLVVLELRGGVGVTGHVGAEMLLHGVMLP